MLRYAGSRLLQSVALLLIVLSLVFTCVHSIGDPAVLLLPDNATPDQIAQIHQNLGLDRPWIAQFWSFMSGAVHGDFGQSIWRREPAFPVALHRFGASLLLGTTAMLFAILVGLTLAVIAATFRHEWLDQLISVISFGTIAIVEYWAALILIFIFAVRLGVLPTSGFSLKGIILPTFVVSLRAMGRIAQFTLESMLSELRKPYIRSSLARGVPRWRIVTIHACRNVAVPLVTVIGTEFIHVISGLAIIEVVFAWPGEGQLLLLAIQNRDLPLVISCVFIFTVFVVAVNFVVDVLYGALDRRSRVMGAR